MKDVAEQRYSKDDSVFIEGENRKDDNGLKDVSAWVACGDSLV